MQATAQSEPTPASRRLSQLVVANVGLALVYFATGKLGLLLAVPPGYATAVWPPSGIALAALLLYGPRLWPGVLLGSAALNFSLGLQANAAVWQAAVLAAGIGGGAALQAWLGARLLQGQSPLLDERAIARFYLVGGPLVCLVNASWSVLLLYLTGALDGESVALSWGTWWVGDTLGVLLFAPPLLRIGGDLRQWRRGLAMIVPMGLVFALVVALFLRVSAWEAARVEREFQRQTIVISRLLHSALQSNLEVLYALRDFHDGSSQVTAEEFRLYAERVLSRHSGFRAVSWNRRISDAERAEFEAGLRQIDPTASIHERDEHGARVPAPQRPEYIVVQYIEPVEHNRAVLGYNVDSEPTRHAALLAALRRDAATATGRVELIQDSGKLPAMLVFVPSYRHGLPLTTYDERRAAVAGYVVGVFRIDRMVAAATVDVDRKELSIELFDDREAIGDNLLYSNGVAASDSPLKAEELIDMAGRRWLLRMRPAAHSIIGQRDWQAWMVLAAGLLFNALFGAFLLLLTRASVARP